MRVPFVHGLAVAAAGSLLTVLPAQAQRIFGMAEVDNIPAVISNLTAFSQSAGFTGAPLPAKQTSRELYGSANPDDLDPVRPVRIYFVLPAGTVGLSRTSAPTGVRELPVLGDGGAFVAHLGADYVESPGQGTVRFFSSASRPGKEPCVAVLPKEGVALLGSDAAAVREAVQAVQSGGLPNLPRVMGAARVSIDVARVLPLAEQAFEAGRKQMQSAPGMTNTLAVLDVEAEGALAILRQLKGIAIGFQPAAEQSTLFLRVDARPGTLAAACLACMKPASARYEAMIPADAFFGMTGGGADMLRVIANPYADYIRRLFRAMDGMPGMGSMAGQMSGVQDLVRKSANLYAGDYAFAVLPATRTNGLLLAQVLAVTDPALARTQMRDSLKLADKMYKGAFAGLTLVPLPDRTYAGVEILSYRYQYSPTNSPELVNLPGAWAAIMQGPVMGILGKCVVEQAVVDKDWVTVMGSPHEIEAVIDRVRKGGDAQFANRARALFGETQAQPTEIGLLSLSGLLSHLVRVSPGLPPEALSSLPPPGGGVGFAEYHKGSCAIWALRLTSSELKSLKGIAPAAKGLMMNLIMGAPGGATVPGQTMPPPRRPRRPIGSSQAAP